ncbi:hypothetical protein PUN28_007499 [Cardiocondyla obscurior]|uniref:Uncharacterized protein n=1 Tax=Cardiocondyla obscurior TaxID=286306 RepID=A0AAW2G3W0_9HYME
MSSSEFFNRASSSAKKKYRKQRRVTGKSSERYLTGEKTFWKRSGKRDVNLESYCRCQAANASLRIAPEARRRLAVAAGRNIDRKMICECQRR